MTSHRAANIALGVVYALAVLTILLDLFVWRP